MNSDNDNDGSGEGSSRTATAGLVAGTALLVLAVLAGFSNFVVVQGLVVPDDPAGTAANVLGSQGLFRLGVLSFYAVVALDIVAAWGLYRYFTSTQRSAALLAGWFRITYACVFLVAVGYLATVPEPITSSNATFAGFTEAQRHTWAWSRIETFEATWNAALVLFGVHLAMLGYLMLRHPGRLAKAIGVLLAVAGVGYVFDSVVRLLVPGTTFGVSAFTFVGEAALMLWLVVRGVRGLRRRAPVTFSGRGGS